MLISVFKTNESVTFFFSFSLRKALYAEIHNCLHSTSTALVEHVHCCFPIDLVGVYMSVGVCISSSFSVN